MIGRTLRMRALSFGTLCLLAATPSASAKQDCEASIRGELVGERPAGQDTRYLWKADLTTTAPCANVAFVLTTKEERPDGEVWITRTPKRTKLSAGTVSVRVGYRVRAGNTLVEWKFEVTGCETCDSP
jgi:hypothetical protein